LTKFDMSVATTPGATALPAIEVTISSKHSPQLADGPATGKLDAAFLRPEEGHPDLAYKVLIRNLSSLSCRAIIDSRRARRST